MLLSYTGKSHKRGNAFSLVELSIVLVILGLLVGGVLTGKSLIRASQLRGIVTEYQNYYTATQSFRDKYFSMPGDLPNGTSIFGTATDCALACPGAAVKGTCNGNGNGLIETSGSLGTGEAFQFWKQLQLAGFMAGTALTGISSCHYGYSTISWIIGENAPASRLPTAGWGVWNQLGGDGNNYSIDYGNYFSFGGQGFNFITSAPILTPVEAWNIDTKLDDGMPGTGKVVVRFWALCSTSTSNTDFTGTYKLTDDSNISCALYFPHSL